MRGERNNDKNVRKFITITDTGLWEKIDLLMTLPRYSKSFNKVINNALDYGLPKLCSIELGIIEETEDVATQPKDAESETAPEYYLKIVRLLREVVLNVNINKSLLSSLFKLRELELKDTVLGRQLSKGQFQETPDCLSDYEIGELRKLRD